MPPPAETVQWIRVSDGEHVRGNNIAGVTITQDITVPDLAPYVGWWTRRRLRKQAAAGRPLDGLWWAVQARLLGDGTVIVAAGRNSSWAQKTKRQFMQLVADGTPGWWVYRRATMRFELRRR